MAIERELKFKVAGFDEVRSALDGARAVLDNAGELQTDVYYDTADSRLLMAGAGLRLRMIEPLTGELPARWLLTYKDKAMDEALKARREIQSSVGDGPAVGQIIEMLGFRRCFEVQKRRWSYVLGRCRVELDELPVIGHFVEIEGPDGQTITNVRDILHLTSEPISDHYLALIQNCLGSDCHQALFDNSR